RDEAPGETLLAAASSDERLRRRHFAALEPDELARVRRLVAQVSLAPPPRRTRRQTRSRRGRSLDVRASLRRAHRRGGDPILDVRRRHRVRPRRLVLICDVSGSMEPYARVYLQLLLSAVRGARAEAFVFATRLTCLTRSLQSRSPDAALERAARAAPDWSGGTRIGAALGAFNDCYGRRGLARGAVVVILSDGWERDEPARLGREMERLARLAHRVIWVNPRRAAAAYRPLAGGMAAALPHVDVFVSGHSVQALEEVVAAVAESK
ncbi:MAG: vWA domain-containing protein, partial [Acidimicrobiales bacterium]